MTRPVTQSDVEGRLSWTGVADALSQGHRLPVAEIGDLLLGPTDAILLNRAAFIPGLGFGVKAVTVIPGNAERGAPTIHGAMMVFGPETGEVEAIVDSDLVTEWKTAGDSVLGARLLARPDSRGLLIVGSGVVARSLVRAYGELFPDLAEIRLWNRTPTRAEALAAEMRKEGYPVTMATDLADAAGRADIIATATMAREPILRGEWIRPGTHVDLIGAFKPDMREADDELMRKARLFVDSRKTTISHIGELMTPIAAGVIAETDILADLYDLCTGTDGRTSDDDITVFKNGGGAHLDLMTARYIIAALP